MIAAAVRWGSRPPEQDCDLCRPTADESVEQRARRVDLRRRWGCDAPADRPWGAIACTTCPPRRPRAHCSECGGSGKVQLYTCPNRDLEDVHFDVLDGAEFLEAGLLPIAGGWDQQSATFCDAVALARRERAQALAEADERSRRELERNLGRRRR